MELNQSLLSEQRHAIWEKGLTAMKVDGRKMSVTMVMVRTVVESSTVEEVRLSIYLLWS